MTVTNQPGDRQQSRSRKTSTPKTRGTLVGVFGRDLPLVNRLVSLKPSGFKCLQVALHGYCMQGSACDAEKEQEQEESLVSAVRCI